MQDLITDAIYILIILGLVVAFTVSLRRHFRQAAEAARTQADLHRQLAEANNELAEVAFGDDHDELAKGRFEMADLHTEGQETMLRVAEGYDDLAQWPVPRWLRRRSRQKPEA